MYDNRNERNVGKFVKSKYKIVKQVNKVSLGQWIKSTADFFCIEFRLRLNNLCKSVTL